ncbi:alpha/beta hydrolase [Parabacteroides sp. Marseille-P3160]|uniref:alpha/beta hydrolase n=1 Tax=Parabacteroides sp. Marseille-P3160 TaxID=1917887 RepID=UPI0009BAD928|nr:alpha/beta hydrolase [Parabacteroides sp. Marseille-P3160]
MKRRALILFTLFWCVCFGLSAQYRPDVLGDRYVFRTFRMEPDAEGPVVCTLVKKDTVLPRKRAILYIHGYNDYFFQKELGDSAVAHGYHFYALDLRKYGRSLRPYQDAFYCRGLEEYFADIDTALSVIRAEGNETVYLMAHSTGGLITPLYLHCRKEAKVSGLVLNSPFLDMNTSWLMEKIGIPVVSFLGRFFPRWKVQGGGGMSNYARSLLKEERGEWNFNTEWKKSFGHPKRAAWLRAIHRGHCQIRKGLSLACPVLVLSSDRSAKETEEWKDTYLRSDVVLDVEDIQKYGAELGTHVTRQVIPGGLHDLILSPRPARDQAYRAIFRWLEDQEP